MRIFINYATEDRELVEPLYQGLKHAGFNPWMDIKDILPGEVWEEKIYVAILDADVFLACISSRSITKKGYLRREINKALTIWRDEKLQKGIHLIPVRLEECQSPKELASLQWVNLFDATGWEKLLQALQDIAMEQQPTDPPPPPPIESPTLDWIRIVYVNTDAPGGAGDLPVNVKTIHDWTWCRSAHIRWSSVELKAQDWSSVELKALEEAVSRATLIVLDWSANNADRAERSCRQIRSQRADLPILILIPDSIRLPNLKEFISADSLGAETARSVAISNEKLNEPAEIAAAFRRLNVPLALHELSLDTDEYDLAIKEIIGWIADQQDQQQVYITIQKFFPAARRARLTIFGGDWAETRLCQMSVDGQSYLLKFFDNKKLYEAELKQHAQARKWLGKAAMELLPILALKETDLDEQSLAEQSVAFPAPPARYPLCYKSGTPHDLSGLTLKECYRSKPDEFKKRYGCELDDFLEKALARLLEVLVTGQPEKKYAPAVPWGNEGESPFWRVPEMKSNALETLNDLEPYERRLYDRLYDATRKWKDCDNRLRLLFHDKLPAWLKTDYPVVSGHIHGAPIARNCLVNPDNPQDLRLIECGGYCVDGRLVSNLALLECDLKLVLMSTDDEAEGFFDLESSQLPAWCRAESEAIRQRLGYTPNFDLGSSKSVRRAYSLVGQVRQRARQISEPKDSEGRHYFAALLYWTLDLLKSPAVRPTKKLLALHSAAEIVRVFDP